MQVLRGFWSVNPHRQTSRRDDSLRSGPVADAASLRLQVRRVLCFEKSAVPSAECPWTAGRDVWWADVIPTQPAECEPEWMDAEDPLFLLYTSGSTGNPKAGLPTLGV